jgi:prepilin-type N-terminal cleavage/methylation domain-containing protein
MMRSEERVASGECRKWNFGLRSTSGPHHSLLAPRSSPRGITLVELLITILIISILAGLILGVASVAGETARKAHSRHMVMRLHTLLMEYYDTFKTRRVEIRPQVVNGINNSVSASKRGEALAAARLYALRELILMEIPDRWSDVLLAGVPANPTGLADARYPYFQDSTGASATGRTSLAGVYLRRYAQIARATNSLTGNRNDGEVITDNQGAECLYMIITLATGDGEARSLFGEGDIGDVDGDGAPEFLDGWGRPINFLRWAPGFESEIQLNANELGGPPTSGNTLWATAATNDHDPFDIFRRDPPAFRLVPLIYSAGRDEIFGIRLVKPYVAMVGIPNPTFPANNVSNWPIILPYRLVMDPDDDTDVYLGTHTGEGATADNVHNHLLGQR